MKNLLIYFFEVLIAIILTISHAPVLARTQYTTGASALLRDEVDPGEKKLKQLCDSLVLDNNFEAVINVCTPYLDDSTYSKIVIPYLIGAYYFIGDSIQSREILAHELEVLEYLDVAYYIVSENLALIKYFNIDHNREPVVLLALKKYRSAVNATRKPEGEQIIRFFIEDQRIRKLKYIYVRENKASLEQLNLKRLEKDNAQNASIYAFYRHHDRYFSEQEVGKNVSYLQPIFFSHITDISLRQNFFRSILEKAVKEGTIDRETMVNFILRTESFINPDFWNTIIDRLPEIRKQYGLAENYIYMPF